MSESQYSEPRFVGSFKCGKGHEQEVQIYVVYKNITDEEQREIDIKTLKILGFL